MSDDALLDALNDPNDTSILSREDADDRAAVDYKPPQTIRGESESLDPMERIIADADAYNPLAKQQAVMLEAVKGERETVAYMRRDPAGFAVGTGMFESQIDPKNLIGSIQARTSAAGLVSASMGVGVPAMSSDEVAMHSEAIMASSVQEQMSLLLSLKGEGDGVIGRDLTKAHPILGAAFDMMGTSPEYSSAVLAGFKSPNFVLINEKRGPELSAIEKNILSRLFDGNQETIDSIGVAARAMYANTMDLKGYGDYKEVVKKLVGATTLVNANGSYDTVMPYPTMKPADFADMVAGMTRDDFIKYGNGSPMTPDGVPILSPQYDDEMGGN